MWLSRVFLNIFEVLMNLLDFPSEEIMTTLNNMTVSGGLEWFSDFPIPLDDPNAQTFYFQTASGTNIYFETNYDPVCMGDTAQLYWYNDLDEKRRIILDYSSEIFYTLKTNIQKSVYIHKIQRQYDKIDELNVLMGFSG